MKWVKVILVLLCLCFVSGCIKKQTPYDKAVNPFWAHIQLDYDEDKLLGPFKVLSSITDYRVKDRTDSIAYMNGDKVSYIYFRGTNLTKDENYNNKFGNVTVLYGVSTSDDVVYLLKDSAEYLDDGDMRGIVYRPTSFISTIYKGKLYKKVVACEPAQLQPLLKGRIIADRSDKEHSMYEIFTQAEDVAKEHKKGVWKKKTDETFK